MKTLIRVDNANCAECLNEIQDVLMARALVRSVYLHAADGCVEVEHDHDAPSSVPATHRSEVAAVVHGRTNTS